MKSYDENHPVKNLPDVYKKNPVKQNDDGTYSGSNNAKILATEKYASDALNHDLMSVFATLDINQATGKTLDLYGETVGQPRGVADDAKYRIMIRGKIAQNIANGNYKSTINALCIMFECDPSELLITVQDNGCGVEISKLPLDIINSAGFTANQVVALVNRLLPVGVAVKDYLFEGTFELASSYEDMKVDGSIKGLTDTYENVKNPDAIGGYLGITMGDENEAILPI